MTKKPFSSRFSTADLVSAVYLAGSGASAKEIAEAIGRGATSADVHALLHRYGVRLIPKTRSKVAFVVVVDREAFEAIEVEAGEQGIDPRDVAARLIEVGAIDRGHAREESPELAEPSSAI